MTHTQLQLSLLASIHQSDLPSAEVVMDSDLRMGDIRTTDIPNGSCCVFNSTGNVFVLTSVAVPEKQ